MKKEKKNMSTQIKLITPDESEALCRAITKDLPEYFGLPECNEHYAIGVRNNINFALQKSNQLIGLLSLEFPYPNNANIYWMALFKKYHAHGYGRQLITTACDYALRQDIKTMTVETLSPNESDKNYLKTYQFYERAGFAPLFNLKPDGYIWNMVYMCKILS